MTYKIVAQPRAWFPVTWTGVAEDGSSVDNRIELQFTELRTDPSAALLREAIRLLVASDEIEDGTIASQMATIVARMASDWRGVAAENGEPMKWSSEHLTQLMAAAPPAFAATIAAYQRCLSGNPEARAGNFEPSRAAGPAAAAANE